tara:strand:- start:314 stop:856 length:543 start_codon:yes stop_codon:yes gene_type:complete
MVKSITVNKDGSISKDGKTYKSRGEYAKAMKEKRSKPKTKKSNLVRSDDKGTFTWERTGTGRMGKKKKYLTNFSDVKARAKKTMTSNKAYSASTFKEAFDQATKGNKSRFTYKNKEYLTTKGKRETRFGSSKDIKKVPNKEERQMKKRVEWMKKRKEAGKSYSAKNLAELTAKLEKVNVI